MAKKPAPTFESQMQRLQEIIQELERADLPLEKNVALYKEGRALARSCKEMLDAARHEIRLCDEQGGETPFPFGEREDDDAQAPETPGHPDDRA